MTVDVSGPTHVHGELKVSLPEAATCAGYARLVVSTICGEGGVGALLLEGAMVPGRLGPRWKYADGEETPLFLDGGAHAGGSCQSYLVARSYRGDHWDARVGLPDRPGREAVVFQSGIEVPVLGIQYECLPSQHYGRK